MKKYVHHKPKFSEIEIYKCVPISEIYIYNFINNHVMINAIIEIIAGKSIRNIN